MQDSIEDYIRISRNTKSDPEYEHKVKISKDIVATAQRKQECETYAMKIVMFFIDGKLRPEIFLKCLKYINQDYYQDVVEERAITKLCGYPLCNKKIPDMPKQKYFISTKANKVYDISERKNYCSNFCYNGSVHVKNQIDSSPLWLRNHAEMKDCKLLPATAVGSPGVEIDQGVIKEASEVPHFTSVVHFAQMSLKEAGEVEQTSSKKEKNSVMQNKLHKPENLLTSIKEGNETDDSDSEQSGIQSQDDSDGEFSNNKRDISNNDVKSQYRLNVKDHKDSPDKTLKSDGDKLKKEAALAENVKEKSMSKEEKLQYLIMKLKIKNEPKTKLIDSPPMKIEKSNVKKSVEQSSTSKSKIQMSDTSKKLPKIATSNHQKDIKILNDIKTYVSEWITIETFMFIYGEDKIKQILDENKMGEYFDKLKITERETSQQLKYMNICKRLHMQELAEEKFDNAVLGNSLKPLPDFKQLKVEVQELDLKVKSFYKGVLYEKQDTNFPTSADQSNENEANTVLPMVDITAQNALRRKVLLNSINKTLKKLIQDLNLEESYVMPLVHELVKSFKLQAHNVIFKPTLWALIAVILLNMLSLKEENIQTHLEIDKSKEQLDLILSKYPDGEKVIRDILKLLDDIDKYVVSYITHER